MKEKSERDQMNFQSEKKLLEKKISDLNVLLSNLKNEHAQTQSELQESHSRNVQIHQSQINSLAQKLEQTEASNKGCEDDLKNFKQNTQKEIALLKQNKQFLELSCEEYKNQLTEAKRQHESTIQAFQINQGNDRNSVDNQYVYSLKEKLENE